MAATPRTQRLATGIERVFRATPDPGVFQEVYLHFIHLLDENGNKVSSKLEKQIPGQLYRVIQDGENYRSQYGEVEYTFPNGQKRRMVALAMNYSDMRYGRF